MHCKFSEIQSHNRSKNVKWVYQCVRVFYHNIQKNPKLMYSPIKRLPKVSNWYCIDRYAKSYDKDQQQGLQKINQDLDAIQWINVLGKS